MIGKLSYTLEIDFKKKKLCDREKLYEGKIEK